MLWLMIIAFCRIYAVHPPENEILSDTARIRLLKQELAGAEYINQQKECYYQLERLAMKTGDEKLLAKCCCELAYIMEQQSNYPSTIEYVQRALRYYEAKKDSEGRANCYRIIGTLYLLLSPEQADVYFRKCINLSSQSDSVLAVITKCMMSIQPGSKNDKVFDEILNINPKILNASQVETVNYLYAVMAHQSGDTDTALEYALKADAFFSAIPRLGYMTALNKHELASLHFARGDLEQAKQNLAISDAICKRDDYHLTAIGNMRLLSDILHAEGREMESLMLFKRQVSIHDSLLGLNQVRSLTGLLMRNLLDETVQEQLLMNQRKQKNFYFLLAVIMIFGITMLYYFRDSFIMRKEKYTLLSQLSEQNRQLASNSELKQHLSVIMFEYKKGLDYYIEKLREKEGTKEEYQHLNQYIDEANGYIDGLKKWMDEYPYHEGSDSLFNACEITGIVAHMLEIVFISKQITIQHDIGKDVFVFGNQIYFGITFEILLFTVLENTREQGHVILSSRENRDFVIFTIANPKYVYTDEEWAEFLGTLQKTRINTLNMNPIENSMEICLKCIYENNGNAWLESNYEQGTVFCFSIPKKAIKSKK